MKYAVFTVSLPTWTPQQAVAELRDAGYDGIEWRVTDQQPATPPSFWAGNQCTWPLTSFVADAPQIKAMTAAAGLAIPSLGTYVTCENLDTVEIAMQGAALVGAPQLRVGVPSYNGAVSYLELRRQARAQYQEVAALAKKYGLRALIEIHMGNITPSASAAAAFLEGFDPQYVGVIHDAGNMVYEGYEHYRLGLEVLGAFLGHVHIKNSAWRVLGQRANHSVEWQAGFAPLREGSVDFVALFQALQAVGYDGWLSFEDFTPGGDVQARIRDNLAYIKGLIA